MTDQPAGAAPSPRDGAPPASVTPEPDLGSAAVPAAQTGEPVPLATSPGQLPQRAPAAVTPLEVDLERGVRHGAFGASGTGDTSGFGGLVRRQVVLPDAEKPYGGWFDEATGALERVWPGYGDGIERVVVERGELTLHVRREALAELARLLRDDPAQRYELLSSLSGVHYPDDVTGRPLHVVYHLTSLSLGRRIRLEVALTDADPSVASVTPVWPTADWQERETFDFFGVLFDGHPDLTRIEMPDDWIGHPQRKDYPLGGIAVEYKGADIPPPDQRRAYT
jgi:NADH-quinone oxidoreductase subunit C